MVVPLSTRLKQLRAKKKLTQLRLAKQTGLTPGYIAHLETGSYDPKLSSLRRLSKSLGVTISALVEYQEEP
ncbi:MAG: helix-turn-helix transcriptional regulator [Nitrospirota bacterium]|nr:helix-turn-helix transcriptional regulator [Nitrospirota bacterium]